MEIFEKAKGNFLKGNIDLLNNNIALVLVGGGYTPNMDNDEFQNSISPASIVSEELVDGKEIVGSVFDANDVEFQGIPAGTQINFALLVKDTGANNTSLLIGVHEFVPPIVADGNELVVNFPNSLIELV